jgi:hypothetical protein
MVAAVCAYHVNWIRERHAFLAKNATHLAENEHKIGSIVDTTNGLRRPKNPVIAARDAQHAKSHCNLLWLFGEQRVEEVNLLMLLPRGQPDAIGEAVAALQAPSKSAESDRLLDGDLHRAHELFPEADVFVFVWQRKSPEVDPAEAADAAP